MNVHTTATLKPHKPGWMGKDITRDKIEFKLTPAHLAAIKELMGPIKAKGLQFQDIRREDFQHPALNDFLDGIRREIIDGKGLALMTNFPVDDYSLDDLKAVYWGIGTHIGRGCSQSAYGDYIGLVQDRKTARGYTSNRALDMHTDSAEIVGLACIRQSEDGGLNTFSSSIAIFNIIQREHPEYMPVYQRGFPYHRKGEEAPGTEPITPFDCPIFAMKDGVLSCRYSKEGWELALKLTDRAYTPFEAAAVKFFDEVALRDGVRFEMKLSPGEVMFQSNFEMLHGRSAFIDRGLPGAERLMMRLWLVGHPPRPLPKNFLSFDNKSGLQGIDKQEGRVVGQAKFTVTENMVKTAN